MKTKGLIFVFFVCVLCLSSSSFARVLLRSAESKFDRPHGLATLANSSGEERRGSECLNLVANHDLSGQTPLRRPLRPSSCAPGRDAELAETGAQWLFVLPAQMVTQFAITSIYPRWYTPHIQFYPRIYNFNIGNSTNVGCWLNGTLN